MLRRRRRDTGCRTNPLGRSELEFRTDEAFMARAIELASQGEGLVSPNPMVGAVVVRDGKVIGEGFHRFELLRHAESYALELAGTNARGGTLYCNLEPCSHQGRTPPCTKSVIESGISRVVIGMIDPDPRVNGRGIEQLKDAGVGVAVGVLEAESELLNEIYVKNVVRRVPFVHQVWLSEGVKDHGAAAWIPSETLLRSASRYDAIALGSSRKHDELFLAAFLNREWHRDPMVFASDEPAAVLKRSANLRVDRRIVFAKSLVGDKIKVKAIGSRQGNEGVESTESTGPTSILVLPGAEAIEGDGVDKVTIVCDSSVSSRFTETISSVSGENQTGDFVELTGYPATGRRII